MITKAALLFPAWQRRCLRVRTYLL